MISISYILRYWKISAWSWFIVGRPQIEGLFCGMSSQIMSHQLSNTNSRRARKSLRLNYPALLCINNSKSMPSQTFPNQLIYLYHIRYYHSSQYEPDVVSSHDLTTYIILDHPLIKSHTLPAWPSSCNVDDWYLDNKNILTPSHNNLWQRISHKEMKNKFLLQFNLLKIKSSMRFIWHKDKQFHPNARKDKFDY